MSGTTGSGKSLILETLQKRGEQVCKSDVKGIFVCILLNTRWFYFSTACHYFFFYRTRVRSLAMLVSNWLTHCCLVNLMWPWRVRMPTQNLLRLLLLLMLMLRNVLTTIRCRFGSWSLVIKLSFCSDLEHKASRFGQDFKVDVHSRFWNWSLIWSLFCYWCLFVVMKFNVGRDSEARLGQDF